MVAAAMWLGFVPIAAMLVLVPCMRVERTLTFTIHYGEMPPQIHSRACDEEYDHNYGWPGGLDQRDRDRRLSRCWEHV